jgi:hypothetical protein
VRDLKRHLLNFGPLVKMLGGPQRVLDSMSPTTPLPYASVDSAKGEVVLFSKSHLGAHLLAGEALEALVEAGVSAAVADISLTVRGYCATVRVR